MSEPSRKAELLVTIGHEPWSIGNTCIRGYKGKCSTLDIAYLGIEGFLCL